MSSAELDSFLRRSELRALRIAEIATGNRDEALDIVQDAMIALAQRYAGRAPGEWAPLFHRILQSKIRDWHRRFRVRRRWRVWLHRDDDGDVRGDGIEQHPDERSPGPGERAALDQSTAVLESALHALPLRQQQAFLLRCLEGLDTAGTARAMGCSEGSVKTHYSRALSALRQRLEGYV